MNDLNGQELVSFSEFVSGIENGTMKYEIIPGERFGRVYPLIRKGTLGFILNSFLTIMSFVVPFVLIPVICYLRSKWILLLGVPFLLFSMMLTKITFKTSRPLRQFLEMTLSLTFLVGTFGYFLGTFHILTFVIICAMYEYFFCFLCNYVYKILATKSLMNDSEHFHNAITNNRIKIISNPVPPH